MEIVANLRGAAEAVSRLEPMCDVALAELLTEAADEIERLRREHDTMRNRIMRYDPQWADDDNGLAPVSGRR